MTHLNPAMDTDTLTENLKAASLDQLAAELARKATVYASMAADLSVFARFENDPGRVAEFSLKVGHLAEQSRRASEGCQAVCPGSQLAKEALQAAREAADIRLALRVFVGVVRP